MLAKVRPGLDVKSFSLQTPPLLIFEIRPESSFRYRFWSESVSHSFWDTMGGLHPE